MSNIREYKAELETTKKDMINSFEDALTNTKIGDTEIEKLRAELLALKEDWKEGELERVLNDNINKLNIMRKLNTVLNEKGRYAQIDEAVEFLDKFIDGTIK